MEGPSIYLATEWLSPFVGKAILEVDGNTHIGKERLHKKKVLDIFSWGKHLVFQFDDFALRVHFMLFGSFQATVKGTKVTGDYPKKDVPPRLELKFNSGEITLYSCSLKYLDTANAKELYDFSTDVMSSEWSPKKAIEKIKKQQEEEIADVLLDQSIFSGVGNIIKNEVLFIVKTVPTTPVKDISAPQLKKLVNTAREFSFQFYEWRKKFELKKHYQIYRKKICTVCGDTICKKWTGTRKRVSYFCQNCQK
ncbi:MAG: endonuclease [Parachlamydiaceae bacterium]|nr:endonuclease [Parachlamydiaceae bacterium]